jgi:pimeloyl-ACP methyl ester carboxylesterase
MKYALILFSIASHIPGLNIALTYVKPTTPSKDYAILFLHGSSFPAALSFGFRMNNYSWMDHLADNGHDVYALDFLGYGHADRYPETGKPVGRAQDVYKDVDKAIDFIIQKTGKKKVYLIGHSWGGSVAALYATKFPDKVAALILFAAITPRSDTSAIEQINGSYEMMTPEARILAMKSLAPDSQLEADVFKSWGHTWLESDPLAKNSVRFPSGPSQDIEDLLHNKSYYNPADIKVPVLLIRGERDQYPDNTDDGKLFESLENAPYKKYVVIEKGTHVMHLEKSRYQLYDETLHFLKAALGYTIPCFD